MSERDKTNLDILWLKDESLMDLENLPKPEVIVSEIVENLETVLNSLIKDEIGEAWGG